jgi:hypothetical protein
MVTWNLVLWSPQQLLLYHNTSYLSWCSFFCYQYGKKKHILQILKELIGGIFFGQNFYFLAWNPPMAIRALNYMEGPSFVFSCSFKYYGQGCLSNHMRSAILPLYFCLECTTTSASQFQSNSCLFEVWVTSCIVPVIPIPVINPCSLHPTSILYVSTDRQVDADQGEHPSLWLASEAHTNLLLSPKCPSRLWPLVPAWLSNKQRILRSTKGGTLKPNDRATWGKFRLLTLKICFREWESYARMYDLYASWADLWRK